MFVHKQNYDISVIIPVFRVEEYVAVCIRSVMLQQLPDDIAIECLLVDDCSPDNSLDICLNLIKDYHGEIDFKIIRHTENKGLSQARNSGINEATGKYLFFLDSDDFLAEDCLEQLYLLAKRCPESQIVYGLSESFPDPKVYKNYFDFRHRGAKSICREKDILEQSYLKLPETAWNKLILADWLKSNSLYFTPKLVNEDYDWHLRAYFYLQCYASNLDGRISYYYRQRESSIISGMKESARRINILGIMSEVAFSAPFWDKVFFKYIVDELILFYFDKSICDTLTRRVVFIKSLHRILESKNANGKYSFILKYMTLPHWIMKVRILDRLMTLI